jgi:hypothetical protein
MNSFFLPYIKFMLGAAFSLQQTLEGLQINTALQPPVDTGGALSAVMWDLGAAIGLPVLFITGYVLVLSALVLVAGWCIAKRKGVVVGALLLLAPGIASVLGAPTGSHWVPAEYHVGSGHLGSPWGMAALAFLGLATGWVATVIGTSVLKLSDMYRHGYDHLWYALGILAGVLFVADLQSADHRQELERLNRGSREASAYLLRQVRTLDRSCRAQEVVAPAACRWAAGVQYELAEYAHYSAPIFWQFGPKASSDVYAPYRQVLAPTEEIRLQLAEYNARVCPVRKLSARVSQLAPTSEKCESPPVELVGAFPEPLAGLDQKDAAFRTVAIATEALIPELVALREAQERKFEQVQAEIQDRHYRWLFYLFLALLAGGKVGNATARLLATSKATKSDPAPAPPTNRWRRIKLPASYAIGRNGKRANGWTPHSRHSRRREGPRSGDGKHMG